VHECDVVCKMKKSVDQKVYIIDDDDAVRDSIGMFFESEGIKFEAFASANAFLRAYDGSQKGCLVVDIRMPGISGLELQDNLNRQNSILPIIFITGHGDLPMAVEAMREGAIDFIRKPIDEENLLHRIQQAFESESGVRKLFQHRKEILLRVELLTDRERQIFELVTRGETNKVIAIELGISERTVEVHRSNVMKKMDAKTMAQLVRMQIQIDYKLQE